MTIRKRLVATLLVRDGFVVNSYGFSRLLPVGQPKFVLEELQRWEVDEVCVLDLSGAPLSSRSRTETSVLLRQLAGQTPISFGGGINSPADARTVIGGGVERVILGGAAFRRPELIKEIVEDLGEQAVVVSVPFRLHDEGVLWCMPRGSEHRNLEFLRRLLGDSFRGEVLLQSMRSDGALCAGAVELFVEPLRTLQPLKCMVMGGVTGVELCRQLLEESNVSAVCIGIQMHAKELLSPRWKVDLGATVRPYRAKHA